MECEISGRVSNVDNVFWYFELNNGTRVHMSIMISQNRSYKLPELGSNISIKNVHRYASTFVACSSSIINGTFEQNDQSPTFIHFVRNHQLGAADLIMMDKCLQMLDKNFKGFEGNERMTVVFFLLNNAIQHSVERKREDHICLNKCSSFIDIISVSSCRFIKIEPKSYPEFPYWSFGVNTKPGKNFILFGTLEVQSLYGFFMLKDSLYQIACLIYNCTADDLAKLVNQYVLIKDYKVITEIYNAEGIPNVECMIVNFTDIIKMDSGRQVTIPHIVGIGVNLDQTYKYSIEFQLKKKSNVLIGYTKEPEYYLDILMRTKNGDNTTERAFLVFPREYVPSLLFLENNGVYKLYHKEPLQTVKCYELTRIANHQIYQIKEKEANLQIVQYPDEEPDSLMTVEQCKKNLINKSDLLSFRGVLKQKRFANSLSSRTAKRSRLYGFGTPGTKVNQLVFSYTNSMGKEEYLDCYLNNWENILMPLALIPEMEVIVRNVAPQSKKYLKATAFTTIDIVSYRPASEFQTVNLYENEEIDWGPRYFLGKGNNIPFSVIIWGRVSIIQVLSVKLSKTCKKCKLVIETAGCCIQCGEKETDTSFLSKLHVTDEFGQSKVLVKDIRCMKVFLDLQNSQWNIFSDAFNEMGNYNYSFFDENDPQMGPDGLKDVLTKTLTEYLTKFNKYAMGSFDLKCRKLDSNPLKNGGRPLWFLLDIRKC